jgi:Protein of unknown function (DUF4019)
LRRFYLGLIHFRSINFRRIASSVLVVAAAMATIPATAQEAAAVDEAKSTASAWLALVDGGQYLSSWTQASSLFQSAVNEQTWESAIRGARTSLGAVTSRQLQSATFTHELPGAPYGDYVVIKYTTQFEKKSNAVETVTPLKSQDGSWRVSGYFVSER